MAETYKVYLLERSNHVEEVQFVTADADEAAMEAARKLQGPGKREVWRGERRVGVIDLRQSEESSSATLWLWVEIGHSSGPRNTDQTQAM